MFRTVVALCLCLTATGCVTPVAQTCQADAEAMLDMTFIAFDQGPDGWRSLHNDLICCDYADDVLAQYRSRYGPSLGAANTSLLTWHEAQLVASQGDAARAATLMKAAAYPGEPQWQTLYREGSIAFLEGDMERLQAARETLSQLPRDVIVMEHGQPASSWPPNLEVLNGLISCFGKPYGVAYACRLPSTAG